MTWFKKYRVPIFFFHLLLFSSFQSVLFGRHAFEMTGLLAKEMVDLDSVRDQKRMGAICNSGELYSCSIRHFEQVLLVLPADREALANLAVATAILADFARAYSYFSAYFGGGGNSFDVMYWYAFTLRGLGRVDEAIQWAHESLGEIPAKNEYHNRFIKFLDETVVRDAASNGETQAAKDSAARK